MKDQIVGALKDLDNLMSEGAVYGTKFYIIKIIINGIL